MTDETYLDGVLSDMRRKANALSLAVDQEIQNGNVSSQSNCHTRFLRKAFSSTASIMEDLYILSYSQRKDPAALLTGDGSDTLDLRVEGHTVFLRLPYLMRRGQTGKCLLYDQLLSTLIRRKDLPRLCGLHIDFVHCYPTAVSAMPKDVDNWEYKRVIDIITYCFGASDCPMSFDLSMTTKFSDRCLPGVYVQISPKSSDFSDFEGFGL